jgi:hypothetical protein
MLSFAVADGLQSRSVWPAIAADLSADDDARLCIGDDRIMEPGLLSGDTDAHLGNLSIVPAAAAARGLRSIVFDVYGGPDEWTVRGDGPGLDSHNRVRRWDGCNHR